MKNYGTINLGYAKMDFMEGVQIKTGKQIIYTVYGWDKNFQLWIYENLFEKEDEKERTFSEVSKLFGAEGKFKFYPEWWCDGYEFERLECTKFERNGNGINFFFGSNMPFLEEIDENVLYIALFELAKLYEEFKETEKTEKVGDEIVVEVNRINKSRYDDIDRNLEIQMLAECSAVNISLRGVLYIGYGKDLPIYRTGPDNETVENVNHALYEMALLYEKYKKEAGN